MQILSYGALCSNASLQQKSVKKKGVFKKDVTEYVTDGDPTEAALVIAAHKAGFSKEGLQKQLKKVAEFPFDSTRKMMSVVVQDRQGKKFVLTKGAPDVVLSQCTYMSMNPRRERMAAAHQQQVEAVIEQMAGQALRTIAIAYRPLNEGETCKTAYEAERGLTLLGFKE